MTWVFRVLLSVFGAVIVAIGSAIALFGGEPVGAVFGAFFTIIVPHETLPFAQASLDADSELRFYSVFFAAYGAGFVYLAKVFPRHAMFIPAGLFLFFLGGLARLLSFATLGAPHPFFALLMCVELILPPVFWLLYRRALS